MISEFRLLRKLRRVDAEWRLESQTDYVKAVRYGIKLAQNAIEESLVEPHQANRTWRQRAIAFGPGRLLAAIEAALNLLCRGDTSKAKRRLQKAVF